MEELSEFSQVLMKIGNCDKILMLNSHEKNVVLQKNLFCRFGGRIRSTKIQPNNNALFPISWLKKSTTMQPKLLARKSSRGQDGHHESNCKSTMTNYEFDE